jgi:4-alpha-glucanotransferase
VTAIENRGQTPVFDQNRGLSPVLYRRRAGILLHPTSLPGPEPHGTLGRDAYYFIDFLARHRQSVWQMLPIGPPAEGLSPYQSLSVQAGNPALISLEVLVDWGWLDTAQITSAVLESAPARTAAVAAVEQRLRERGARGDLKDYARFLSNERYWLDDYALFRALRDRHGSPWTSWPAALRDRHAGALRKAAENLAPELAALRFEQFVFFKQWHALKRYANERGVLIFGDMPIFAGHDSADVWAGRQWFRLDANGLPEVEAGAPPDAFADEGQHWGNPLYAWDAHLADGFRYWRERCSGQLALFDLLRIDHFRGFCAAWEVPQGSPNGRNGRWAQAPGEQLFDAMLKHFPKLPFVAEDLGHITPDVVALRERYGYPGMKVLQFAFDGDPANPYLPHNHTENAVIYTGTHDNDTTLAWYQELPADRKVQLRSYLGHDDPPMPEALNRLAFASVCRLAILPMQDVMRLGHGHRMNYPNTKAGNWCWRFDWSQVTAQLADQLTQWTQLYGRG